MRVVQQFTNICIVLVTTSLAVLAQATTDPNNKPEGQALGSAGFNDMLGKQIKPGTYATEQQPDGSFLLSNKMQTVSAHVTTQGTRFDSIGNSEGKGGFALQLTQWGREQNLQTAESSQIYRDGDNTYHTYVNGIAEKFSNSSGGIQQDFIVPVKPEGEGSLHVQLQVGGATVIAKNDGAIIQLASGRQLTYDRLNVIDSENKKIQAHIVVAQNNTLDVVVDDATAQYPLMIDPTVGDQNWVSMGAITNGYVYSIAVSGSNVYVGGSFTVIGSSVAANGIAMWNGSSWSALGTGISGGWVMALAIDSSGNVYAGGSFFAAGDVANTAFIAKWNGSVWSALDTGMNNYVYSLAIDSSGNVYVGGIFNSAGGVAANDIAKWNGSKWSALGTGMDNYVLALSIDSSGNVYAGGEFTTAGGVTVNNIAQWNGSAWSALGTGMNNWVLALAIDSSGNVYAGGMFSSAGGVTAISTAKWNGSTWSAMGSGTVQINAITIDGSGNVYAGGIGNTIVKWNGSTWITLGTGISGGGVEALAIDSSGNMYVGGQFTKAGGVVANNLAEWSSGNWISFDSLGTLGINNKVNALVIDSNGNMYVGGNFTTAGGVATNHVAKWNGNTWSALGSGVSGISGVNAMVLDSSGNLYVGGWFSSAGGTPANNIAKWNGANWNVLGSGTNGNINTLAIDSSGILYAGGNFTSAGGNAANFIAKWDGSQWSAMPGATGEVKVIAINSHGDLYVGGDANFCNLGCTTYAQGFAKWNGTGWSPVVSGIGGSARNGNVYAIAFDNKGDLYAGGYFSSPNNIAMWDGSNWNLLGAGTNGEVDALVVDSGGNLYVAGQFTSAGGIGGTKYIAKWDGSNWSSLGSGVNQQVSVLANDLRGHLYVGGAFTIAGDKVSTDFAEWLLDSDNDGIIDINDAFPNNAVASVDSDSDGYPDQWNEPLAFTLYGCTTTTVTCNGLTLDAFPNDALQHAFPAGTYPAGTGFAQAPAGSYALNGVLSKCPAGTYNPNTGSSDISACLQTPAGSYSGIGSSAPTVCAIGTYQSGAGSASCILASAGNYVSVTGAVSQTACIAGTYQPNTGQASCITATTCNANQSLFAASTPTTDTVCFTLLKNDFNADHKSDILLRNLSTGDWNLAQLNGLTILNQGSLSGAFNDPDNLIISTADFNGDGTADILTRGDTNGLIPGAFHIDLMSGPNVIDSNWLLTMSTDLNDEVMSTKDFNKDGKADVLLRNKVSGVWTINYMNGTSDPAISTFNATLDTCYTLQGDGDYDGNGYPDLLLRKDHCGGASYPWLMYTTNGTANILASGTLPGVAVSANWGAVVTDKDFDGDGKADLLIRFLTGTSQQWVLYNLNGVGAPSANGLVNVAVQSLWQFAAEGDFNADGKADLLLRNANNGQWYIYLLNNTAVLSGAVPSINMNQLWTLQGTDDYNGDGKSDVLVRNTSSGQWYMNLINGTAVQSKGLLTINSDVSYVLQND